MKRFSLIGRLGADDKDPVAVIQQDSTSAEIQFVNDDGHLQFGVGHALEQLTKLGLTPTENALDLVFVAAMINAADTRVSRQKNAQDGWTREIDLYVPVSDPSVWSDCSSLIQVLLKFLTGDRWRIIFRGRPSKMSSLIKAAGVLPLSGITEVSLFSGGLDSLIGAIDLLKTGRKPLLVSHYWDGETAKAQKYLLGRLTEKYGEESYRLMRVRLGFGSKNLNTGGTENTQRGRSFLFYSLASLAASSLGAGSIVNVPENGLIALNVPLEPSRLGALSTRTAHPYFMARMNELLNRIGLDVKLQNRYRHMTKGEMARSCEDPAFLRALVEHSMSCSSPAKARYMKLSPRHCGYCVPCLIRRASIAKGVQGKDPTLYVFPDLHAQNMRTNKAEGEHIRSFQMMIERIQARPDLADILVHKPGPLVDAPDEISRYADVFRRGILEVADLLKGVTCKPD